MPLSNAQYDEIMHEYDERQLHNRHILETRRAEVLKKLTRLKEIGLPKAGTKCSVSGTAAAPYCKRVSGRLSGPGLYLSGLQRQRVYRREKMPLF